MSDKVSRTKRSEIMSLVKSSNTKPEIIVRKFLFNSGFRFRLHDKTLPGKPDIILKKHNALILVNGCFWHGHETCNSYQMPKSNSNFWSDKIEYNKKRDVENIAKLRELGWNVIIIWECELKKKNRDATLSKLLTQLKK